MRRMVRFFSFLLHAAALFFLGLALYVFVRRGEPVPGRPSALFLEAARPLVFAHRGDSARGAENMLPAFERAARAGADVLELDVRRTADDVVVVLHDASLLRTAGVDRAVVELTFAELSRIDNGAMFRRLPNGEVRALPPAEVAAAGATSAAAGEHPGEHPGEGPGDLYPLRGRGLRVPTLAAVFRRFPKRRINIEIKPEDPRLPALLYDLIRAYRREDSVLVGSVHAEILRDFRALSGGRVATGATMGEVFEFWACFRLDIPCPGDYVALQIPFARGWFAALPGPLRDLRGTAFLDFAHRQGVQVHYWTVNEADDMRMLIAAGADGIMTDHPARAVAVVREKF